MARREIWKTLPDELVERIMSVVPFPTIFKFRCLSKSWLARLSIPCEGDDDATKHLASSFHELVGERSINWKTFFPVCMSVEGAIMLYDQKAQTWLQMSLFSFLPSCVLTTHVLHMEGPLLLMCEEETCDCNSDIYVANVVTRTWRPLPPPPSSYEEDDVVCSSKLVLIDKSLGTYRVIVICEDNGYGLFFLQIFDSRSDSWTRYTFFEEDYSLHTWLCDKYCAGEMNAAYFNGFVYTLGGCDPLCLWAVNLEDGKVEKLEFPFHDDFMQGYKYCLVVCNADLLMVVGKHTGIQVLKIDLESLSLVDLADGAVDALQFGFWALSEGNRIFCGVNDRILTYETEKYTWSWLPSPPTCEDWVCLGSFQPGLGPFSAV